jgi:hypothetical protein
MGDALVPCHGEYLVAYRPSGFPLYSLISSGHEIYVLSRHTDGDEAVVRGGPGQQRRPRKPSWMDRASRRS